MAMNYMLPRSYFREIFQESAGYWLEIWVVPNKHVNNNNMNLGPHMPYPLAALSTYACKLQYSFGWKMYLPIAIVSV